MNSNNAHFYCLQVTLSMCKTCDLNDNSFLIKHIGIYSSINVRDVVRQNTTNTVSGMLCMSILVTTPVAAGGGGGGGSSFCCASCAAASSALLLSTMFIKNTLNSMAD